MEVAQYALDDIILIGAGDDGDDLHPFATGAADLRVFKPDFRDELRPAATAFAGEVAVVVFATGLFAPRTKMNRWRERGRLRLWRHGLSIVGWKDLPERDAHRRRLLDGRMLHPAELAPEGGGDRTVASHGDLVATKFTIPQFRPSGFTTPSTRYADSNSKSGELSR
jgi:hypothetical protein